MDSFIKRLKEIRKSRDLTQIYVAESVGFVEQYYQKIEYGKIKPSYDVIVKLADFFDVSTDYLLGRSDDPTRH